MRKTSLGIVSLALSLCAACGGSAGSGSSDGPTGTESSALLGDDIFAWVTVDVSQTEGNILPTNRYLIGEDYTGVHYACRFHYHVAYPPQDFLLVGSAQNGACTIANGGGVLTTYGYDVLTYNGYNGAPHAPDWVISKFSWGGGGVAPGPYIAGYDASNNPIEVCRVTYNSTGVTYVGWMNQVDQLCHIVVNGQEVDVSWADPNSDSEGLEIQAISPSSSSSSGGGGGGGGGSSSGSGGCRTHCLE